MLTPRVRDTLNQILNLNGAGHSLSWKKVYINQYYIEDISIDASFGMAKL